MRKFYSTFLFSVCIFILKEVHALEYNPNQIIIKYKNTPNVNLNPSIFNSRSTVNRYTAKKINDTNLTTPAYEELYIFSFKLLNYSNR